MTKDITFMVADSMAAYCEKVQEIGVAEIAKRSGLKERIVRKFVNDTYASKNADVRKIQEAVKSFIAEQETTKEETSDNDE